MASEAHWVLLTRVSAGYEADIIVEQLKAAGIPALVRGPVAGIFGFGFSGSTPQGAAIHVPSDSLEAARQILEQGSPGVDPTPDEAGS